MCGQLPHIFEQDHGRFLSFNRLGQIEEQGSANIIKSSHRSDNAEWLTGESSHQNVMIGDGCGLNHGDIASWLYPKVMMIGASGFLINIAGENTLHTQLGCGYVETTNAAEHISES